MIPKIGIALVEITHTFFHIKGIISRIFKRRFIADGFYPFSLIFLGSFHVDEL